MLSRVLRWEAWGIAYEADPRHAELLVRALGDRAQPRTTPGAKSGGGDHFDTESLPWDEARLFRACAARANYLGLDRTDVAFASKELCRRMSVPTWGDLEALRRLAQYLAGSPRLVQRSELGVYADTEFAGCSETRRPTSGGIVFNGVHVSKHWSTTQKY